MACSWCQLNRRIQARSPAIFCQRGTARLARRSGNDSDLVSFVAQLRFTDIGGHRFT